MNSVPSYVLLEAPDRPGLCLRLTLDLDFLDTIISDCEGLEVDSMRSIPETSDCVAILRLARKPMTPALLSTPRLWDTFSLRPPVGLRTLKRQTFGDGGVNWNGDQPHAHFWFERVPLAELYAWRMYATALRTGVETLPTMDELLEQGRAAADAHMARKALEPISFDPQPDWRAILLAALRSDRPKRLKELRMSGELQDFLDRVTQDAREYYRACRDTNPIPGGATEMVVHDIIMEAVSVA